jgi:hypothetical protein
VTPDSVKTVLRSRLGRNYRQLPTSGRYARAARCAEIVYEQDITLWNRIWPWRLLFGYRFGGYFWLTGDVKQFRNYCGLTKIARCGFSWRKTTKRSIASVYTNCETALAVKGCNAADEGNRVGF